MEENNELLEEAKKKSEEYLNNWKRERADFLNYKKDEMERIGFLVHYAKESFLLKLMPILDSIYLSAKEIPKDIQEGEWAKGFLQIQNQITEFLKKEGVEEVVTIGQTFDPNTMEIVEEIEIEGETSGTVAEELQKGYTMQGKVLRPARVKVVK